MTPAKFLFFRDNSHARNRTFFVALIFLKFFNSPDHSLSQDDPPRPTQTERATFESKLQKLREHRSYLPYLIDDVIRSLTDTLLIRFACPEGYRVKNVEIKITTKQIRWSRRIRIGDEIVEHPSDIA
ncbi:hypothetical protein MJD09_17175, partial [bacterium]|nr:hypothetical protein [bacterium]